MESTAGNTICQIGIVVRDLFPSRQAWADLLGCAPPPVIETADPSSTAARYRGRPTDARRQLGCDIELLETDRP